MQNLLKIRSRQGARTLVNDKRRTQKHRSRAKVGTSRFSEPPAAPDACAPVPDSLPDSSSTGVGLPYRPDAQGVWLGGGNDLRTTVRTPTGECVAVLHPRGTAVEYTPAGTMTLVRVGTNALQGATVTSGPHAHMVQGGEVLQHASQLRTPSQWLPPPLPPVSRDDSGVPPIDLKKVRRPKRRESVYEQRARDVTPGPD